MSEKFYEQSVLNRWNRKIENLPQEQLYESELYYDDISTRLSIMDSTTDLTKIRISLLTDNELGSDNDNSVDMKWKFLDASRGLFIKYSKPVPVIAENGSCNLNNQIRFYEKGRKVSEYSTIISEEIFGWQLLTRESKNGSLKLVESKEIIKPTIQFVNYVCEKIADTGVDKTQSTYHKGIKFKESLSVEQKLGFLAAMKEFDRVKLPLIELELMEHLAVIEMYSNGIDFVNSLKELVTE